MGRTNCWIMGFVLIASAAPAFGREAPSEAHFAKLDSGSQNQSDMRNGPCPPGAENRESALCADWKAADAAAESATATRGAERAAWSAVALGLATFVTSLLAALLAWRSYQSARAFGQQELRPYLVPRNPVLERAFFTEYGEEVWMMKFSASNVGKTPAIIVAQGFGWIDTNNRLDGNPSPPVELHEFNSDIIVEPGETIERVFAGDLNPKEGEFRQYVVHWKLDYRSLTDAPQVRYSTECQRSAIFMPTTNDESKAIDGPLTGYVTANDSFDKVR